MWTELVHIALVGNNQSPLPAFAETVEMLLQTSEYNRPETRLVVQAPGSIKRVFHFACWEHAGNAVFFNATKVGLRIEQHHLLLHPYNIR